MSQPTVPTEPLFEVAFRDASSGMALVTLAGEWISANAALCHVLGRTQADLTAHAVADLTEPSDWQRNTEALRAAVRDGATHYSLTQRYRHADGHYVATQADVSLVRGTDGRVAHLLVQLRDLSEQLEAQDARDAFYGVAPDPLAVVDAHGVFQSVNPAWHAVLGWTPEALVGRPLCELLHEADIAPDERPQCLILIAGRRARARRVDGSYRWMDWSVRAGTRGRWFLAGRDVTAEREAEELLRLDRDVMAQSLANKRAALSEAHARLSLHTEHSPLATVEWSGDHHVVQWSARAEALFGWKAGEVLGRRFDDWSFTVEEDTPRVREMVDRLFNGQPRATIVTRNYTRDGRVLTCEWHNSVLYDSTGRLSSVLSLVHDVSDRIEAQRALRESEARFRITFEQSAVGIAHVDLDGGWLRVNRRLCELLGYDEQSLQRMTFAELTHPDDLDADLSQVQRLLAGEISRYAIEKRYRRKDGSVFWANLSVSLRRDDDGEPLYFLSVVEDIDARKLAEQALQQAQAELEEKVTQRTRELERLALTLQEQASQDPLTRLPNRRALLERLERAIDRARRYGSMLALLFIDLDRFKAINDRHGHDAGDDVLRTCANRLVSNVRRTDIVARLGGDEFVVVLEQLRESIHIEQLAEKLRAALVVPMSIKGQSYSLSASIGVSVYERDGTSAEQLLQRADRKMYAAKAVGGDAVRSEAGELQRDTPSRTDRQGTPDGN